MAKIKCIDRYGKEYEFEETEFKDRKSVYGIYIKDNRVLLVKDRRGEYWEAPGGGVNEGETDIQALEREIKEETGLNLDTSKIKLVENRREFYYSLGYRQPWRTDRYYFLINITGGEVLEKGNGEDTTAVEYIPLDKIDSDSVKSDTKEVIKKIIVFNNN